VKSSTSLIRRAAVVLGVGAAAGTAAAALAGRRRWTAETQRLICKLASSVPGEPRTVILEELSDLPAPVQRYFRRVLKDGQSYIAKAFISQWGDFRSKESDDPESGWQPFTATQVFATSPPGFVWDARIQMAPVGTVWVRDSYVTEGAALQGAILGTLPVVNESDGAELRAGSLQRYLAESVWFPTMLLPQSGVRWSPIDDSHARAALSEGETTVTLDFEIGPDGQILSAYSAGRLRSDPANKGSYLRLPWGGRYRRYEEHSGMLVPVESQVYWIVNGREQPYYRGRNSRFEYQFHHAGVQLAVASLP
jgi:hypothetical protein